MTNVFSSTLLQPRTLSLTNPTTFSMDSLTTATSHFVTNYPDDIFDGFSPTCYLTPTISSVPPHVAALHRADGYVPAGCYHA